ncbi:MAG: glucose-6-phosphate dehydrogenase, partial [Marinilabiliales bacterium]|nr:glucose-6-phosphate dehydrogenase [Marinilabiliales bacterium]
KRKLIPARYELRRQSLLPERFAVVGVSRTELSDNAFRDKMREFLPSGTDQQADVAQFLSQLFYFAMDPALATSYGMLKSRLEDLSRELQIPPNFLFYLSTPPSLYRVIPKYLAATGLHRHPDGFRRVIIEKPFGTDLQSARELNASLLSDYAEEQLYRIDHYLGKETVQNMLVTRFSNGIFEPVWNHNFIERVEITAAETLGVEERGGYYDGSGALRDMVQNHLMQLLAFVAMEPPVVIEANAIRNEMLKVFQSLRPFRREEMAEHVKRGQYTSSVIAGETVAGYRDEPGVQPQSRTETFVAMRLFIDNFRWAGVPFYIRTGKKLPARVTEVVIYFKTTPHHLFAYQPEGECINNQLVMRIQPDEGILLKMGMKVPGAGFRVRQMNMDFHYSELADPYLPSAYSRLLLDCMLGDATLYTRSDAVEKAWEFVQPILDAWKEATDLPVLGYPTGTWGPESAGHLVKEGDWRKPCKNLAHDGEYCEL